jgi:hypothetical protein
MHCQNFLLAAAFLAVIAFYAVAAQENGTIDNQSNNQSTYQGSNQS